MSAIFGTPRRPAYLVNRTDREGRPVSLDLRLPDGHAVLFTGPPGTGKTLELDRAQALARQNGWTCLRVDASPREPLEHRFIRAVTEDLGTLRQRYGVLALRRLKRTLRDLTLRARRDGDPRFGAWPALEVLVRDLTELAASHRKPVLLMVDNLEAAADRDLAAVAAVSVRLERAGGPVFLIVAGGEQVVGDLAAVAGERAGGGVTRRFDVRRCDLLPDDELRPALVEPLRQAGVPFRTEAVDRLVRAAGGDPGRLRELGEAAVRIARPPEGVTAAAAEAAAVEVAARAQVLQQWAGAVSRRTTATAG